MIARVAEKAVTNPGVTKNQPLNFQLYYGDKDRPQTINTVYLEDGNPKLDLCLAVFNESSGKITFKDATASAKLSLVEGSDSASADKCHFSLRFEKDLQLKPSDIVEPNEWQVNYSQDDHFITLYFLSKKELFLLPKALDNDSDTVRLIFKNLAAYNGIIKSSNVELIYGSSLVLDSKGVELKPTSSKNAISVTNHPDHRDIPLQFRFIGPNTILNDGTTENSLKLQIINRPTSNNTRPNLLLDKANSKFIVDFEIGDGAEALIPSNKANKIKLATSSSDWKVPPTQNGIGVTVDLKTSSTKDKLVSGEAIELDITGIVTSNPSGVSFLYITYQNIGNYPDGRLVVPVEKTPLLYRDKKENNLDIRQVGIGINNPLAKLHIQGGDALISGRVGIGIMTPSANAAPQIHLAIGDNDTGLNQQGDGKLAIYTNNVERVRIDDTGNVGIGTTTPKIHLAIGDDDTGLRQQGENKLAIYTNNAERVRIDENGNVGIGTTSPTHRLHIKGQNSTLRLEGEGSDGQGATLNFGDAQEVYIKEDEDRKLLIHAYTRISLDSPYVGIGTISPSAKLHVIGDAIVSGKFAIGTTESPTIHLAIGDGDTGLNQQGDGKLAIYTNSSERVRIDESGNVGIGTTTPSAKLDVKGPVKLGDGSTAWKRIIFGKVIINTSNISQTKCYGQGITKLMSGDRVGHFKLYFKTSVVPEHMVITVSTQYYEADNFVSVIGITSDHFEVQTRDANKGEEYTSFHFIAIELNELTCIFKS